jgi:hypothetical protein
MGREGRRGFFPDSTRIPHGFHLDALCAFPLAILGAAGVDVTLKVLPVMDLEIPVLSVEEAYAAHSFNKSDSLPGIAGGLRNFDRGHTC